MKKRLYLLLAVSLLVLGVLVGCTSTPDTPADSETESGMTESATEAVTDPAISETQPAVAETETETEPETRPVIVLPTDPADVVALIDAIPDGSLENESKIDLAYAAWAALSDEDRAKVTNYDTLRTRLQELADAYIVREYRDDRIPHGELILGVYVPFQNFCEQELQDLAATHTKMLFANPSSSTEYLDAIAAYGMGAIYGGGFAAWRAPWQAEGYGDIPYLTIEQATESMSNILNHPAVWGFDVSDEMGSNNFWWLGEAMDVYNREFFSAQIFSNNHPSYGGCGPLGAYSYEKFVRNYANFVDGQIMFYDHYVYQVNDREANFLNDLYAHYSAAADFDRDFGVILQLIDGPGQGMDIATDQFKYQAYASMAFGNKYVVWACYAGTWGGGWDSPALDAEGNKTQKYYDMKECNTDLTVLSPIYMRYTAKGQTMLYADPTVSKVEYFGQQHPLDQLGQKTITDLAIGDKGDVLVGFFEKNVGEGEAFMLVNNSDIYFSNPITSTITFRTVSPASVVTAYVKGVPTILEPVDGVYTVEVKDADAVFVTVSEPASINANPAPAPVGQLTVAGTDISELTVVIPANATERERQAAEVLVTMIANATGKTLAIVTDAETPAAYISLGNTVMSSATDTACATLKGDGYALVTANGNLYIKGVDENGAGTLIGVYGFLEDYLGYRFYTRDLITVPAAEAVNVPDGLSETNNPAFLHREVTFHEAVTQKYPLIQKYNGHLVYGDMGFAGEMWAGYTLRIYMDTDIDKAVCLTSEESYAKALANARQLLACDTKADYLDCSFGQDPKASWPACPCENCQAIVEAEGTPMGLLLTFVNRLATDLKADYPDLKVTTMATAALEKLPATVRPAENVVVRLVIPEDACRYHAINDDACTYNAELRAYLQSWFDACEDVMILDNETARGMHTLIPGANLLTLYDNIQYFREQGVIGYQHTGYDFSSTEMDALRNYLMSRLMWDEDMTREEYLATMDEFLEAYYGAGWTYIRQYIDKIYNTEDIDHSIHKWNVNVIARTSTKSSPFVLECIELWNKALEAAETATHARHVEQSSIHVYQIFSEMGSRNKELEPIRLALIKKYGLYPATDIPH